MIKKIAQLTGHNASIYALAQGQTEGLFLSAAGDGWVVQWDLAQPELGKLLAKVETQIFSMCVLHDSEQVVVGNMNGGVHWVDLVRPENTKNVLHHQKGVYAILREKEHIYTGGGDGILTKWSIAERRTLESLELSAKSLRSIAFCAARKELAIGASDGFIYLIDIENFSIKRQFLAHENSVFCLHYSPDNQQLISGGRDAQLKVWTLEKNCQNSLTQPAHWFTINDLAFHPNGHLFATASRDKTIKIWDAKTYQLLKVIEIIRDKGHLNSVNALLWHPYKNLLISASDDRTIIIWEMIKCPAK